jgi:hypothetical protein
VILALKDLLVSLVQQGLKAPRGLKEAQVLKEIQVLKGI